MSEVNEAPLLVIAGIRNENSLGWSAAETWLSKDPNNQLLATVRSPKSFAFVEAKGQEFDGRIDIANVDWADPIAAGVLYRKITGAIGDSRSVSGLVHAIANAEEENFKEPAHQVHPEVYSKAFDVSALSLHRMVQAALYNLRPKAGIVTFGFEEAGRVTEEYGGALSTAKVALSHLVKVLGVSLGQADPPARTLEIVPGFIDTYAGRGVGVGISKQKGLRLRPAEAAQRIEENFIETSALPYTSSDAQRKAAGELAIDFIRGGSVWDQVTGEIVRINAGHSIRNAAIMPVANLEQNER